MRKLILLFCFLWSSVNALAEPDSLRISTYNLLFYGKPYANRHALKNTRLQPVLNYIRPHIACFNEISTEVPALLDTLLQAMPYPMRHGGYHNSTGTEILDGLFWKAGRFVLERDSIICNQVRDIVAYDLYYNDPLLGRGHDTVRLKVITAHLKSSNALADRTARAAETAQVAAYLTGLHAEANYLLLGDLNLYSSAEAAYQNLTAPADTLARLNDPLNLPGPWDENPAFAMCHTQSPRTAAIGDGGATGGLDSRFDFILVSDAVMRGTKGLKYLPGSYRVVGNDGLHYDKAITDTPNYSVPAALLDPLLRCSDHLPVVADFLILPDTMVPAAAVHEALSPLPLRFFNPVRGSFIQYVASGPLTGSVYSFYNLEGQLLQQGALNGGGEIRLSAELTPGWYLIAVTDAAGQRGIWKLRQE